MNADLRRVKRNMESATIAVPSKTKNRNYAAAAVLVLVLLAAAAIYFNRTRVPVTTPSEYVQITDFADSAVAPSLSPDGKMVTFIRGGNPFLSRGQIYVKLLSGGESRQLTNDTNIKYGPVFTPDNSRVAYTRLIMSPTGTSWDTWTIPVLGGEPAPFLPNASGLVWTDAREVMFSKIMGTGLHMGIVASTETRSNEREIYYPAHERAMAHYSSSSPDRKSVLLVEMDRTQAWQPCRLVPFDGSSAGRQVGPAGACTSAAWSPDGKWMYFAAYVDGAAHLWRQEFPNGTPEQITFGPTEEEGIALAPDGRFLITSLGVRHRRIWMHDTSGDRQISAEGFASMPTMSADGKRIYYLLRPSATSLTELYSMNLESGKTDVLLPGLRIVDYDISRDGTEAAFTARADNGVPEIWLASFDRRTPPRKILEGGDEVSFGKGGKLLFRMLEEKANYLGRVNKDGSARERVRSAPILNKGEVSPDGNWVVATIAGTGETTSLETVAIPVSGGEPRLLCSFSCPTGWSPDGRFLYAVVESGGTGADVGKTAVIPTAPGAALPDLPATGLPSRTIPPLAGSRLLDVPYVSPGPGFTSYTYSKSDIQQNLYRIPLH
jgi:Tol biopolymer transport system component